VVSLPFGQANPHALSIRREPGRRSIAVGREGADGFAAGLSLCLAQVIALDGGLLKVRVGAHVVLGQIQPIELIGFGGPQSE
jgi:hypothetical protein